MTISELIKELQQLQENHDDIDVVIFECGKYDCNDGTFEPAVPYYSKQRGEITIGSI